MRILAGKYKNRLLKSPKGQKTRPTLSKVRESIFNILQNQIEGAKFLDLFAGSGAMGIEALSRGAESSVFVERDRNAVTCIKENLQALKIETSVFQMDVKTALKFLTKHSYSFDIIYLDPPYGLDIQPILDLVPPLLTSEGVLILEQGKERQVHASSFKQIDERLFGDTRLFFFSLPLNPS